MTRSIFFGLNANAHQFLKPYGSTNLKPTDDTEPQDIAPAA
ncbi:MAG: hypothetical protein Q3962_00870 [Corynebacterium sp.]|nr:hypothetical protein [Corynebacterium sp.]